MRDVIRSKREDWIDIFRAILIIMVVLGHTNWKYTGEIYWFHMPLFFVISGYLLKDKNSYSLKDIADRAKHYFVPWIFYFILLDIVPLVYIEGIGASIIVKKVFMFLYSGKLYPGVYWFIPVIFVSSIILSYINRINRYKQALVIAVMYIVAVLESIFVISCDKEILKILLFPWDLDVCLLSVTYMYIGVQIKKYRIIDKILNRKKIATLFWTIVLMFFLVIQHVQGGILYKMDMKYSQYDHFIMPLLLPLIFGIIIYYLSLLIERIPIVKNMFCILGRASIVIMYIHIPIRDFCCNRFFNGTANIVLCVFFSCFIGCIIYLFFRNTKLKLFVIG